MKTFELARFRVASQDAEKLLARWPAAVEAIRTACTGLIDAKLVRIDETTWMDIWQWESHDLAKVAAQTAPSLPSAALMFSLITEPPTIEHGEIVLSKAVS